MSDEFLGELRLMSFNFAPKGWAMCNGQQLPINQNQALFSLLGTMYGGNGQTTFALPDLRGRAAIHFGAGISQGQPGGEENHTLTLQEMPAHQHFLQAVNGDHNSNTPAGNLLSNTAGNLGVYGPPNNPIAMLPADVSNFGGSQPHLNQSPLLVMTWCIALQGIFPSRN
jgi:microcystin-dependent protein